MTKLKIQIGKKFKAWAQDTSKYRDQGDEKVQAEETGRAASEERTRGTQEGLRARRREHVGMDRSLPLHTPRQIRASLRTDCCITACRESENLTWARRRWA